MKSILQDWVMNCGLRHQGVLVSAVRGCDTAPKVDASKDITRVLRSYILNAHCGDPAKAKSYIESVPPEEVAKRALAFVKNMDHYPLHYVFHFMHCVEIIGYKHPDAAVAGLWRDVYLTMCKKLHINPETQQQLDDRLNADEETFAARL